MSYRYEPSPLLIRYEPKQERSRKTVRAILDAAINEIETVGASGLRHQRVLDAAGVTQGSLYHHFGSRDGLIDAAYAEMYTSGIDRAIEQAHVIIGEADLRFDPLGDFLELLFGSGGFEARRLQMAAIVAAQVRPSLQAVIANAKRRLTNEVAGIIERFQVRSIIDPNADSRQLAVLFQSCSLGSISTSFEAEQDGAALIDLLRAHPALGQAPRALPLAQ
jgi:AcrR family transcriptional regulator